MGSIDDNKGGGSYVYRSLKQPELSGKEYICRFAVRGNGCCGPPSWLGANDMGRPNGLIDTETSVSGMVQVIEDLTLETSEHSSIMMVM